MTNQTYQEVSKIIQEDLKRFKKLGIESLGEIDIQDCFFKRKKRHPEKYERLTFNTNGPEPLSKDLIDILMDFRVCGILYDKYNIIK